MTEQVAPGDVLGLTAFMAPVAPKLAGAEAACFALDLFENRLGLPFPPVPEDLLGQLRTLGPAVVGTRADRPGLDDPAWFLAELAADPPDYLLFGHDGHGTNSWAIRYYLVQGPLALMIEAAWGGAYTDNEAAGRRIARAFTLTERLLALAADTNLAGRRLTVLASDSIPSRWGVLPSRPGPAALAGLRRDPDPLLLALGWLASQSGTAAAGLAEPALAFDWSRDQPIWG